MGARTSARESALMILYGMEVTPTEAQEASRTFFRELALAAEVSPEADALTYTSEIVAGVTAQRDVLDALIRAASENWRLERMSRVDRNLLRIAAWELSSGEHRAVVIDEAVEIAKKYGTQDSGAFVNGVLTKIADGIEAAKPR